MSGTPNTRTLGRTGLKVSELGFGAWGIGGGAWGKRDDARSVSAIGRAIERGITFFDTAHAYGDGHSERLIADTAQRLGVRRRLTIATKIPPKNREWPARANVPLREVYPRDWIIRCTEESLRHLNADFIDLQQLHVWAPNWLADSEWIDTLRELQLAGKIRYIGVSINDHQPDSALDLVRSGWVDAIQVIFNLFDQSPAARLLPLAQEHHVGIIARCPYDEGGLTGSFGPKTTFARTDWRRHYFTPDRLAETIRRADALKAEVGAGFETVAHAALQYVLSHNVLTEPSVATAIPGMRRPEHVDANVRYASGPPFTPELLAQVRAHAWLRNFYD